MTTCVVVTEHVGKEKQKRVKVFVNRKAAIEYFQHARGSIEMENAELIEEKNAGGFPEGSLAAHLQKTGE